jgi:RecA/RadA recombinase/very-short-patch-repair endonuclease
LVKKKKNQETLVLNFKTAYDLMKERETLKRISTGTPIDELIGGGIEEGEVIEFYGEFGCLPAYTKVKCLVKPPPSTLSHAPNASWKTVYKSIQYVKKGDIVFALDLNNEQIVKDKVVKMRKRFSSASEPLLKIETDEGHVIVATGNHPFLTSRGWVPAMKLKVGDHLIAENETPAEAKKWTDHNYLGGQRKDKFFLNGQPAWNRGKPFPKRVRKKMREAKLRFIRDYPAEFEKISKKGRVMARRSVANKVSKGQQVLLAILAKCFGVEMEYPIDLGNIVTFADFALPKEKIAIYWDGDYWHPTQRDEEVTKELLNKGWAVLRLKETLPLQQIEKEIQTLAASKNLKDPVITTITPYKLRQVYDLETEKYHNFIAHGLIVHNSGKSQVCFTLATIVEGNVVFGDCEETFKPERIVQIAKNRGLDPEQTLKNIHVLIPPTTNELTHITEKLPEGISPKLLIIDGLTTLFRVEYIGRETLSERQGHLRKFLYDLKRWAKQTKTVVVVTNQVYADAAALPFMPLEYKELAVGGHTLWHCLDNRIFVRKAQGGTRIAKLVDSSMYPPAERPFKITEKGVEAVSKPAEAEKPPEEKGEGEPHGG